MAQYVEVNGQNIEFPDGMPMGEIQAAIKKNMMAIKPAKQETSPARDFLQGAGNLLAGGVRGAGSIGATLMRPFDTATENEQRRQSMDDALQSMGAEPESWMYKGGKLAGEIAGTAGAGGAIANSTRMGLAMAGRSAPSAIEPLLTAISSGGFSTGAPVAATRVGRAIDMGVRAAGGATSGGVSAGLVNPDDAAMGAAIGGALPPAAKAVGLAGAGIGRAARSAITPESQKMAEKISAMTGRSVDDVLNALNAQGPSILGIKPTVPQILQDPAISQLQRTAINAGDKSIMAREIEQNAQRIAGLDRVAPVYGTVSEAADIAGNQIGNFGKSARANESQRVSSMFEGVDPFNETAIELPIDAMYAAKDKFLGPGTFGKGTSASTAIRTAENIGTQVLDAIDPIARGGANKSQNLEQAVRAAGGIRGRSGELRDVGIRESGTTGLINNKSGQAEDVLAEEMYRRGFIPDNDPRTLLDALRNGRGRKIYANDVVENNSLQRMAESGMGDMPSAEVIAKPVPFSQVQNLRGSINEAWKDASMRGRNQEAAALKTMISEIDSKINAVANGRGNAGEVFPPDSVQAYRDALEAYGMKKQRFDTGPQARMFREGGDGQSAIQGAEIPREFFNSRASQIEDAQSFQRLTQNNPKLIDALKSYAMTDAAQQTTKDGMLSFAKFNKWMNSRDGALKNTMSDRDQALLKEVLQGVKAADFAATGGMAKGSNTVQNAEAAARLVGNGLLDSKLFDFAAAKLPLGGFGLDSLRRSTKVGKAEKLGGLLADPELLSAELAKVLSRQQSGMFPGLLGQSDLPMYGYLAAPVLAANY